MSAVVVPAGVSAPPRYFMEYFNAYHKDARLQYNNEYRYWEVWKDLDVYRTDEKGKRRHYKLSVIRAVYDDLDQRAIDNMNYRRWIGRQYMRNSKVYLDWLKEEEMEAKRKAHDIAVDRIASGLMDAHNISKKRSFNFGG